MINLTQGQEFDGNYQLIRLIDTGGYAEVWEAKYLVAGNTVALKIYPRLDEEGAATIESEYTKLFELQHSNLVNALHFGRFQNYPYLVMRYYPGGNASKKIGDCHEAEIAKIMVQIGGVLKYLHANDIVHQDIKPNNFLLDQKENYYLADLGLSLKVRATIRRMTIGSGERGGSMVASKQTGLTPTQYRAPELFDQQRQHDDPIKATDIWAFGASLYEMMTSRPPFGELGGLMQKEGYTIERLPAVYSEELNTLLAECLAREAWDRPTASKLEKRAQSFLETAQWYEPAEWEQKQRELEQRKREAEQKKDGGRGTVRREEGQEQGGSGGGQQGGNGGGQWGQGGGGQTQKGEGGFGGGQGGGGGGPFGGNGGQNGGQQKKKSDAIQRDTQKNNRTAFIAVGIAVALVVVVFIMANYARHRTDSSDSSKAVDTLAPSGTTPGDTSHPYQPIADGPAGPSGGVGGGSDKGATGNDGKTTGGNGGTGTDDGGGGTGKTEANYLDVANPVIDTKPEGTCLPQLTRLVRNGRVLKAYLFYPGCTGKLSLYGPGDSRSLFIRPHGTDNSYPLTALSWTGEDVQVPADGIKVVATFQCPADNITLLDIREDRYRLDQGLAFLTFKGVHLQ